MPKAYVLFWFDVEDCTVPQSDDAAKRLAWILERHKVRGTMKLVGQKVRLLEQRIRYDVVDALKRHDIGYHSNWHGLRPQVSEYLAPLGWDEGAAEFERREGPGLEDVRRVFGTQPVTYGQPGPNWAPQVFPVLRRWGIPTYVSGFGYVGVDSQPFWYGGVLCTSHMYSRRLDGMQRSHLLGLNFELGKPGEQDKHREAFDRSLRQLGGSGGLISVLNHPCTLVLEDWFTTYLKPRELTEAGYVHFEQFLAWVLAHESVSTVCASELPSLYPDLALGRTFSREELTQIAANLSEKVSFQRLGEVAVSAAEALGLLVNSLAAYCRCSGLPASMMCTPVDAPTHAPGAVLPAARIPWDDFCQATVALAGYLGRTGPVRPLPESINLPQGAIALGDYAGALARVLARLYAGGGAPEDVQVVPTALGFQDYVDEDEARAGWESVMMLPGFRAPGLLELAKQGAWTLKPAVLRA